MCFSSPDIQAPPPPSQDAKQADTAPVKKKKPAAASSSGTVLTGPAGVPSSAVNTGANTVLGG